MGNPKKTKFHSPPLIQTFFCRNFLPHRAAKKVGQRWPVFWHMDRLEKSMHADFSRKGLFIQKLSLPISQVAQMATWFHKTRTLSPKFSQANLAQETVVNFGGRRVLEKSAVLVSVGRSRQKSNFFFLLKITQTRLEIDTKFIIYIIYMLWKLVMACR